LDRIYDGEGSEVERFKGSEVIVSKPPHVVQIVCSKSATLKVRISHEETEEGVSSL